MNIILFRPAEITQPLPRQDPRARHILAVLRRQPGDSFDAGLLDGPRGKGTLVSVTPEHLTLAFAWGEPPPPLRPLILVIGLPRPQTARDILREATTLGVAAMHFVRTDRGEAGYAESTLWRSGEWQDCLITGAAQANCTRLPEVTHGRALRAALASLPAGAARLALDNYEAKAALATCNLIDDKSAVLALGAERGWSAAERELLRGSGFTLVHLGERVLRTETACLCALTLLQARLGWI
ncbi:MAG: RNA methyltransferase [Opitutae bacterium]|nr:RNA methyltransferase [Opitutae bacterium]